MHLLMQSIHSESQAELFSTLYTVIFSEDYAENEPKAWDWSIITPVSLEKELSLAPQNILHTSFPLKCNFHYAHEVSYYELDLTLTSAYF